MNRNEMQLNSDVFSADQIREIEEGMEHGLNVAIYAKKEYMAIQMRQIRLGMMQGLPVENYASTEYDWFQMEEIRKGLSAGVDTTLYASPEIPYDKMRQIRKGLMQGIDLMPYIQLDAGVLKELRKARKAGIAIEPYIKEGYETEQLMEIRHALSKGLNIAPYLSKEYRGVSIREIAKGLEQGLDVSVYADTHLGWQQMREIRLGMGNRLDVSEYARPLYSWQQMREIRLGLENGLDVSVYKSLMYTSRDMQNARLRLMKELTAEQPEVPAVTEGATHRTSEFFITFSVDEMEAYMELPMGAAPVSRQDIMEALKQSGIIYGIREKGVKELLSESQAHKRVLIAKGSAAQTGRDGYYELFFKTNLNQEPQKLPDGSVDYQSIEWFEVVEKDQKLAFYHAAEEGSDGYSVTGKVQKGKKGREMPMLQGKGFRLLPDGKTYVADINGKVEYEDCRLEVSRLLVLSEVTLANGRINFDGCIYIKGNIGSGTVVKATEDIIVDGFVESAVVECAGRILLRQGVNASGKGMMKAGKDIQGKFFEAVNVHAMGDIFANYCLNCEIYTEGRVVIAGKKGSLAGGNITAIKGIMAYDIGNRAGIPTFVKVGVNETIMQRVTQTEEQIKEVNKELNILGNAYRDFQRKYPAEVRNTMSMYLKIENAIYTKEKELEKLYKIKMKVDADAEKKGFAEVVVRGNLYEGVLIEIDRKRWASSHLSNVTIRKAGGRVAVFSN